MKLVETSEGEALGLAVVDGKWRDTSERVWLRSAIGADFVCLAAFGLTAHVLCDIKEDDNEAKEAGNAVFSFGGNHTEYRYVAASARRPVRRPSH